jgi:hypothetical protein
MVNLKFAPPMIFFFFSFLLIKLRADSHPLIISLISINLITFVDIYTYISCKGKGHQPFRGTKLFFSLLYIHIYINYIISVLDWGVGLTENG